MIKTLYIVSKDAAVLDYLKHIGPNLLQKLKKDKAIRNISGLTIHLNRNERVEGFVIKDIHGNQERLCAIHVEVHPSKLGLTPELGVLTCKVLEKIYQLNNWDTSYLLSVLQEFEMGNYQEKKSIFKKTIRKDLVVEVLVYPREKFAEYSFQVTNKKGTHEISFFNGMLDPLRMKYLFDHIEIDGSKLVISDLRKQITTELDTEKLEVTVLYHPKEHSLDFLRKFRQSFEYDSMIEHPADLWVQYVNL